MRFSQQQQCLMLFLIAIVVVTRDYKDSKVIDMETSHKIASIPIELKDNGYDTDSVELVSHFAKNYNIKFELVYNVQSLERGIKHSSKLSQLLDDFLVPESYYTHHYRFLKDNTSEPIVIANVIKYAEF